MSATIQMIEKICTNLVNEEVHKRDYKIRQVDYEKFKMKSLIIKELSGESRIKDWSHFVQHFIEYQQNWGMMWKLYYNSLVFQGFNLPENAGWELAEKIFGKVQEGDIVTLVGQNMENAVKYAGARFKKELIDKIRQSFSQYTKEGQRYVFGVGRTTKFQKRAGAYTFQTEAHKKGKAEAILVEAILKDVGELLRLEMPHDVGIERHGQKYQNPDIEGLRIRRTPTDDYVELVLVEVKAENTITAISDAINQAINYKRYAEYVYIAAPFFSLYDFYDKERYNDYLVICRDQGVGVVSINLNRAKHQYEDLEMVLEARRNEPEDLRKHETIMSMTGWRYCPLCKKVVKSEKGSAEYCAWKIDGEDGETLCMREKMDALVLKSNDD